MVKINDFVIILRHGLKISLLTKASFISLSAGKHTLEWPGFCPPTSAWTV